MTARHAVFPPALKGILSAFQVVNDRFLRRGRSGLRKIGEVLTDEHGIERFVRDLNESHECGVRDAVRRVSGTPHYTASCNSRAPFGYFYNRPIIGDSGPISGGVYLSSEGNEAVVVDEKYGMLLVLYAEFNLRYETARPASEYKLLTSVLSFVREKIPASEERASRLNAEAGIEPDQKVALDLYIESRRGGLRHQALLAAYLMEKLTAAGLLPGIASFDTSEEYERILYSAASGELFTVNFVTGRVERGH